MADARTAFLITIDAMHEGGFQNDPRDRANWTGGECGVGELVGTKYGITTLDMPGADIKNLTPDQAIAYYMEHYWKQDWSQISSQNIANKLADMGVLFGVKEAVETLEKAIQTDPDGVIGPTDLSILNASPEDAVLRAYRIALAALALKIVTYRPGERPFFSGWIKRINL